MKAAFKEKINELKKKRRAVILAHNYQLPEVQEIADFLGDSLELSRIAARSEAELIVFCGVHFMAETASILSPDKTILMPEKSAGCPMADMVNTEKVSAIRKSLPGCVIVSYVNTSASVKAVSDICCTSANAVEIVASIGSRKIAFLPDKHLGDYVSGMLKKELFLYDGYCPVHVKIMARDIEKMRDVHPGACVLVHPECPGEVRGIADHVLSTGAMCRFAKESRHKEFIIGTEVGMLNRLKRENMDKAFFPASELAVCPNMKKNTADKVLFSLETLSGEIKVNKSIRERALGALEGMVCSGRSNSR